MVIHLLKTAGILLIPYLLALNVLGSLWGSKKVMEFAMFVAVVVIATAAWQMTWEATG